MKLANNNKFQKRIFTSEKRVPFYTLKPYNFSNMNKILLYFILSIFLSSCSKELLDLAPISEVSSENYYQSESDFNAAINAAYNGLQGLNDINYKMQEIRADNAYAGRNEAGYDIDNFTLAKSDFNIQEYWILSYSTIFRSNIILDKIDNVELSQEVRDEIAGQAKFIRALVYFDLVRSFGDVPLITKVVSLSESYEIGRSPKDEVYAQIISDLKEASAVLPLSYSGDNIGKATKGAANGLIAKVYLTTGDSQNAKSACETVINSNVYNLLPSYADIWKIENQNSAEIVFAIQYSNGLGNGNVFTYYFAPQVEGVDEYQGTGLRSIRPTANIIRAFEDGDLRKDPTLWPYFTNPNSGDTINEPFFRKFIMGNQLERDGGADWPILRYSDIILMYAEALDQSGDLDGAITQLNIVRSRAFNGDPLKLYSSATITSSAQFREILLHERQVELAAENHRWFDLLRFNKAEEFLQEEVRLQDLNGIDAQTKKMGMQEYQRLYPIPIAEIEKNNKLTQNFGY